VASDRPRGPRIATSIYSFVVSADSSESPTGPRKDFVMRSTKLHPARVTTGMPIHIASKLVDDPLKRNVSRAMSTYWYRP
jgi:hypothetical protein